MIEYEFGLLEHIHPEKEEIDRFGSQDVYIDVHPYEENAVWLTIPSNQY